MVLLLWGTSDYQEPCSVSVSAVLSNRSTSVPSTEAELLLGFLTLIPSQFLFHFDFRFDKYEDCEHEVGFKSCLILVLGR